MKTKFLLSSIILFVFAVQVFAQDKTKIITKEKLLQAKGIEDLLDSFSQNEYEVIGYKLIAARRGKDLVEYESFGNSFFPALNEDLKKFKPGDKLNIEYVKTRSKRDGSKRTWISPIGLLITGK